MDNGDVQMKKWLLLVAVLMSGCATVYCSDGIYMKVKPNAPSSVALKCVGDSANRLEIESPASISFTLKCPNGVEPGTSVGGGPCVP